MRSYKKITHEDGLSFGDMIRLSDILEQKLIINRYKIIGTKYGDLVIIDTDQGEVSTYSKVVLSQLDEEAEKGFPVEVKFIKVKNYYSMAEP